MLLSRDERGFPQQFQHALPPFHLSTPFFFSISSHLSLTLPLSPVILSFFYLLLPLSLALPQLYRENLSRSPAPSPSIPSFFAYCSPSISPRQKLKMMRPGVRKKMLPNEKLRRVPPEMLFQYSSRLKTKERQDRRDRLRLDERKGDSG